jgi:hypothetical protein
LQIAARLTRKNSNNGIGLPPEEKFTKDRLLVAGSGPGGYEVTFGTEWDGSLPRGALVGLGARPLREQYMSRALLPLPNESMRLKARAIVKLMDADSHIDLIARKFGILSKMATTVDDSVRKLPHCPLLQPQLDLRFVARKTEYCGSSVPRDAATYTFA